MNKKAAEGLARIQIAMWLPASCAVCKRPYEGVDDFQARNPRAGHGWKKEPVDMEDAFVDDACFANYAV